MEEDLGPFSEEEMNEGLILDNNIEGSGGVEGLEFEAGTPPHEAASCDAGLELCCPEREQNVGAKKAAHRDRDRAQALRLRRDLVYLDTVHNEKELALQKAREELRACRHRISLISRQQAAVVTEAAQEKEANNVAAVGRLQATSNRLCAELENERNLECSIISTLREQEKSMWHIEILEGQLGASRKALEEEEEAERRRLQERAAQRLKEEKATLRKAKRSQLLRNRKSTLSQKELGIRHQKLVEDAQKSHRIAIKFLKASLGRIREQEQKAETESREHLKRRMDAVLALKNSITANRETLRKFQAWGQARAELAKQKTQAEKEAILAQGGDAFKQLFHQRRRQELEAQKRASEEEQKQRRLEIMNRLWKEEVENRRRKPPAPAQATGQRTLRDKTWCYVADFIDGMATTAPSHPHQPASRPHSSAPAALMSPQDPTKNAEYSVLFPKVHPLLQTISSESMQSELGVYAKPEEETLAKPEIPGLWDEDYKPYQVPKDDVDRKPVGGTKMDKDILARTMEQLRSGVIHKQVVSGREFKGRPFNSKPELIHFKYAPWPYACRFDPPGPMSAGMSCEVLVTFKPMINKDLEGSVSFLAQTGGFSVPLICSAKKCSLSLDKNLIDFGCYVVGETASRVLTLTNVGGLGTEFKFQHAAESCDQVPSMHTSSIIEYEDKNLYDKPLPSISENLFEGNESSPVETRKTESKEMEEVRHTGLSSERMLSPRLPGRPVKMTGVPAYTPTTKAKGKETECFYPFLQSEMDQTCHQKMHWNGVSCSIRKGWGYQRGGPEDVMSRIPICLDKEICEPESEGITMTTITEVPPSEEEMEIQLGEVTEGVIGPFSSIKVPIIFTPSIPGEIQNRFKVTFKNPQCPTLYFKVIGVAIDVPVWMPKPNVDLKICMYDRLYQDTVLVQTRSKVALRLRFEVCKELQAHMELLPETGYIQAMSSYSVQLKFLPRHSLPKDAEMYFDKETRVLEAPMTIWVADQVKPVEFTVQAIITTSDLEISPSEVDFGHCTIYEAIRTKITLHNHSLLLQEFGFLGLPKFVDIQPNDGFGKILPLESLQLDVIFQPTKAKEYSFELVCKTEINREFKLSCRAVGVHPPLELSHYQIKFSATPLYDTSVATLYVINSHLSMNMMTHSVPRIGSQEPAPVGPTSFEFLLPPDVPITISPSVGTVLPGKKCLVQVAFQPVLPEELVRQEALQALSKELEGRLASGVRKDMVSQKKEPRRQSLLTMKMQNRERPLRVSISPNPELQKQELRISCEEYQAAQATLTRSFGGKFDKFVVPCVVASGDIKDRKEGETLSFSPHNTLYLELWCPTVAPAIIVISDRGKTIFNFGEVAVGHRGMKKISIQNISSEDLTVQFSLLNPLGPFIILNPFSKLHAGEIQALGLSFLPEESSVAQETLDIITTKGKLTLTLLGTGVASVIVCSIEGDVLNMGYVIARESVSSTFKLQNYSTLPIKFSMKLDSLSPRRNEDRQQLPQFLLSAVQRTDVVGTQNLNGQSVFSVIPVEGVIDPGKAQDFTVTFSPDHESLYYSDRLQVVLFNKTISHQILLKGAAREHMMFVEGGDPLDVPVESLAVIPAFDQEHREGPPPSAETEETRAILVTLEYLQLDTPTPSPPASRELQVGCIRTSQLSQKKSVEFSLDSVPALQHKGFTVEPSRGFVERGQTKTITISWMPTADFDPDHPPVVSALLLLRGDVKETYKVLLVAQVVTSP
ncbi:cilia- and flagella-associated protein 74 [Echinops telfairi]|uniref:Cilia- and flagella-associated protein 74 n=1 Tax=Echinops telfairi TaxID=9371 RepID=A0AC55DTU8_ECHTE|nr:cilia- and flagella-associated protein 74 [Echinops telfairi]